MLIFYGVIMGIGLGVGYLTPVKNLMLWFAKSLATGITVAGFGLAKAIAGSISVILTVDAMFNAAKVLLEQHFGMKSVSTVHGLALSAWAFAGLSGNQLASFVVSHATDAAHRYSALIPIITVLYAVALASIIAVTLATKGKGANALSSR